MNAICICISWFDPISCRIAKELAQSKNQALHTLNSSVNRTDEKMWRLWSVLMIYCPVDKTNKISSSTDMTVSAHAHYSRPHCVFQNNPSQLFIACIPHWTQEILLPTDQVLTSEMNEWVCKLQEWDPVVPQTLLSPVSEFVSHLRKWEQVAHRVWSGCSNPAKRNVFHWWATCRSWPNINLNVCSGIRTSGSLFFSD